MTDLRNPYRAPLSNPASERPAPVLSRWAPLRWIPASLFLTFGLIGLLFTGLILSRIAWEILSEGGREWPDGLAHPPRWIQVGLMMSAGLTPGGAASLYVARLWMQRRWARAVLLSVALYGVGWAVASWSDR